MRKNILIGILLLAVANTSSVFAEEAKPRLITVSGNAEIKTPPDEAIVNFGVETKNKELQAAKEANDKKVKAVLALAKNLDIDKKYFQTDYINIEPHYDSENSGEAIQYYVVRMNVSVTLKDTNKLEALLSQALEAGANYIYGVEFRTTELRKFRDQVRAAAIKAAKEKAEALAKELGQKIGRPNSVQEGANGWYGGYSGMWGNRYGGMAQNSSQNMGDAHSGGDEAVSLGQISVSANITVTFELLD